MIGCFYFLQNKLWKKHYFTRFSVGIREFKVISWRKSSDVTSIDICDEVLYSRRWMFENYRKFVSTSIYESFTSKFQLCTRINEPLTQPHATPILLNELARFCVTNTKAKTPPNTHVTSCIASVLGLFLLSYCVLKQLVSGTNTPITGKRISWTLLHTF